jgi:hypothetical protein
MKEILEPSGRSYKNRRKFFTEKILKLFTSPSRFIIRAIKSRMSCSERKGNAYSFFSGNLKGIVTRCRPRRSTWKNNIAWPRIETSGGLL